MNAILERGGPSEAFENLLVWCRYEQIRDDQNQTEEATRIAASLARAGTPVVR